MNTYVSKHSGLLLGLFPSGWFARNKNLGFQSMQSLLQCNFLLLDWKSKKHRVISYKLLQILLLGSSR